MDTSKKIDQNIEMFYERNNLDIPEVKKAAEARSPQDIISLTADEKVSKQYKLYKGFIASNRIIAETKAERMQVIPDSADPRNLRFATSKVEQRKDEQPATGLGPKDDTIPDEYFQRKDLLKKSQAQNGEDDEKVRLLDGYQDVSELSYPVIMDLDNNDPVELYNPIAPVETPKEERTPTSKPEDTKRSELVTPGGPPPTKADFVIHEVKPNDTIEKLCIQYNVSKDVIRRANQFTGEEIYMFKTLKIPFTYGKLYESFGSQESDEETKKKFQLEMMNRALKEAYKNQNDFKHEARYYLEQNDYNLDKALTEFEADMEFEKQVVQENKAHKNRRRQRVGVFSCF